MKRTSSDPYGSNTSNSALVKYYEDFISAERPDEILAATAESEIQNSSVSTKTNESVKSIFRNDTKLKKIVTKMAARRYKEMQLGVGIYPDEKIITLLKTTGDDECKKILEDLSQAVQKKLGDFPPILNPECISKILCFAGYKVGITHDTHARLKIDWIHYINDYQAPLGKLARTFTGLAHYFTGEEDLHKAVVKFPPIASKIEHLSFHNITRIAPSKKWQNYLLEYKNLPHGSGDYFSIYSFAKINQLFNSIKNAKCLMLEENRFLNISDYLYNNPSNCEDKICLVQYIHTIAQNNRDLERLIYTIEYLEVITEILPYFSKLKILILSPSADLWNTIDSMKEEEIKLCEKGMLEHPNLYPSVEELHYFPLSDEFFKVISNYKLLKKLYLNFRCANKLFYEEFVQLKGLPIKELGLLTFTNNDENQNFMEKISEALPNLKKIYLEDTDLTERVINDLKNFRFMEEITIRDGENYEPCLDWLFQGLKNCVSLKTLRLETHFAMKESTLEAIRNSLPGINVINTIIKPEVDDWPYDLTALSDSDMRNTSGSGSDTDE